MTAEERYELINKPFPALLAHTNVLNLPDTVRARLKNPVTVYPSVKRWAGTITGDNFHRKDDTA